MSKNYNEYDFDLIVSSEDLNKNRENTIKQTKKIIKKTKLKASAKNLLLVLIGAFISSLVSITIYQLLTIETIQETPLGNYTCRGEFIKICSGSKDIANYLGV